MLSAPGSSAAPHPFSAISISFPFHTLTRLDRCRSRQPSFAAEAQPGEILVSSTVRDLVAGSGSKLGAGEARVLKGVEGTWSCLRSLMRIRPVGATLLLPKQFLVCCTHRLNPQLAAAIRLRTPNAGTHHRQLTGSLIAAPMLTMATSKSHHLRHAIDPSCSEAAARECRRPAMNRRSSAAALPQPEVASLMSYGASLPDSIVKPAQYAGSDSQPRRPS